MLRAEGLTESERLVVQDCVEMGLAQAVALGAFAIVASRGYSLAPVQVTDSTRVLLLWKHTTRECMCLKRRDDGTPHVFSLVGLLHVGHPRSSRSRLSGSGFFLRGVLTGWPACACHSFETKCRGRCVCPRWPVSCSSPPHAPAGLLLRWLLHDAGRSICLPWKALCFRPSAYPSLA